MILRGGAPTGLVRAVCRWAVAGALAGFAVPASAPVIVAQEVPSSREQINLSFAPLVKRVAPAVVNVFTRKEMSRARATPFADDPFFQFFFEGLDRRRSERQPENSLGSGVIIGGDGLIVTNHHVIQGADEIMVVLSDRREFQARLVGADEAADLALLDIEGDDLPALPLGNSDRLEVGDLVIALGNPFGIGQTVTSGIVSAVARSAPEGDSDLSFIQTDAAINPGNSGGALVTMDGALAGINTAIFTRGGGSIGIGFAIPINLVKALVRSIEGGGDGLARPWLGARTQPVDAEIAATLGLRRPGGVLIDHVDPTGPAARAGLDRGDVVVAVDGREVVDDKALNFRLAVGAVGDQVALDVWREGENLSVAMVLETPPYQPDPAVTQLDDRHPLRGATVANLSPGMNRDLGMDMFRRGVFVLKVVRRSPAGRLRLRRGDLITSFAGEAIASVAQLQQLLADRSPPVELVINRDGRRLGVTLGP